MSGLRSCSCHPYGKVISHAELPSPVRSFTPAALRNHFVFHAHSLCCVLHPLRKRCRRSLLAEPAPCLFQQNAFRLRRHESADLRSSHVEHRHRLCHLLLRMAQHDQSQRIHGKGRCPILVVALPGLRGRLLLLGERVRQIATAVCPPLEEGDRGAEFRLALGPGLYSGSLHGQFGQVARRQQNCHRRDRFFSEHRLQDPCRLPEYDQLQLVESGLPQ